MTDPAIRDACFSLMRSFGLSAMIVTLGPHGAIYFGPGRVVIDSPAAPVPVEIVDTVGAGDAFSAIFLLGRSLGWPVEGTLARANEFAAAICRISGAVPKDPGFYDDYRKRWLGR